MQNIPTLDQLQQYNVNRAGSIEAVRASLYDFQVYAAAGQTSLTFFQVPQGQGGKTKSDTNMEAAGSLPAPKQFLIESIECHFYPGSPVDAFTAVAAALPVQGQDVYDVMKSGWLDLFIGSKSYLTEAPIGRFPPSTGMKLTGSATSNSATTGITKSEYATFGGQIYKLSPEILLVPTQNFNVTLNWPALVPMTSTIAGRIGIVLKGILYRNSQ